MRNLVAVVSVALLAGSAGCKKSKSDKCAAAWDEAMALVEALSKELGGKGDKPSADDRKEFMAKCAKLPPDAIDCMKMSKATDPKCAEIMEKAQAQMEGAEPAIKLEWEEQTLEEGTVSVRVPRGWKKEDFVGTRFSPDDDKQAFWQTMSVNRTCGGMCGERSAAEWAKTFQQSEIDALKDSGENVTVIKSEAIDALGWYLRTSVKFGSRTTETVLVGMWQDNDDHYYTCKAELSRTFTKLLPEFEQACRAMKILFKPDAPAPTEDKPADPAAPATDEAKPADVEPATDDAKPTAVEPAADEAKPAE